MEPATPPVTGKSTVILIVWRHQLNLKGFIKPSNVRLVVVGPAELVIDENFFDVIHHVEGPITPRDQNNQILLQKVRELCASLAATAPATRSLCVFERALQKDIAQVRAEFDIEGLMPEQFDQLMHRREIRAICRRGGLATLRCCSFGSVQGKPDAWVECANSQVGSYPMFLRPMCAESNCMHTLCIAKSPEDLRSWIRARPQTSNYCVDYLVEECLEDGHEFIAVASCKSGLIGTFSTLDPKRTLYMSVKSQNAYGIEYMNAEQTRDVLPGIESFVVQTLKSVFSKCTQSLIFVKGFYKSHNTITFLGGSLELRKKSLATLFAEANHGKTWEAFAVEETLIEGTKRDAKSERNGYMPSIPAQHFALVNFPTSDGVLLHQTSISKRRSDMRIVWRVSEGEELLDSDGLDENVLQIFLRSASRTDLLDDVKEIAQCTDITIDKLCLIDKRNLCRRVINSSNVRPSTPGNNQLIRSCTTTD